MFKKLLVGAALTLSSFAFAGPVHGAVPVPPPNVTGGRVAPHPAPAMRADQFDVQQGHALLRQYDSASARRDTRALRALDGQISRFIKDELAESRRPGQHNARDEAATVRQLTNLQQKLTRLTGRFDLASIKAKRAVLADAVKLAERDLRPAPRTDRFARR